MTDIEIVFAYFQEELKRRRPWMDFSIAPKKDKRPPTLAIAGAGFITLDEGHIKLSLFKSAFSTQFGAHRPYHEHEIYIADPDSLDQAVDQVIEQLDKRAKREGSEV